MRKRIARTSARGPRGQLVVEPVGRGRVAVGHVEGDCERDGEALLLEAGRMQVEDELPQAGDRELHGELGVGQHAELIGIARASAAAAAGAFPWRR